MANVLWTTLQYWLSVNMGHFRVKGTCISASKLSSTISTGKCSKSYIYVLTSNLYFELPTLVFCFSQNFSGLIIYATWISRGKHSCIQSFLHASSKKYILYNSVQIKNQIYNSTSTEKMWNLVFNKSNQNMKCMAWIQLNMPQTCKTRRNGFTLCHVCLLYTSDAADE